MRPIILNDLEGVPLTDKDKQDTNKLGKPKHSQISANRLASIAVGQLQLAERSDKLASQRKIKHGYQLPVINRAAV